MIHDLIWGALAGATGLYVGLELLWSAVLTLKLKENSPVYDIPISILVAVRNEEGQILRLLASLDAMDYPREKLQILIGEDRSEDRSAELIRNWIHDKPWYQLIPIQENMQGLRGKQNVLSQLAHHATGELILVTDADIEVSPRWASHMAGMFTPGTSLVSAVTLAEPRGIFGGLQSVDWMVGMGVNGAMAELGLPMTAVGNNMAFRREEYVVSGGYEKMPFSVTEDLLLYRELVIRRGGGFAWGMERDTVNRTQPVPDLGTWLRQRRRWFAGGKDLSWYAKAILGVYYLHMPLIMASVFILPWKMVALAWGARLAGDMMLMLSIGSRTGDLRPLAWLILYQAWAVIQTVLLPLNQLWPGGVIWKGRKV